jgi:membrane protease YdiL (CAAX protease family)
METNAEKKRAPKLYAGFIVFAAAVLLLIFAAAPVQNALGLTGLLLTELMILACAVAAVFVFRYDIRKALPIKRPKARQVFGVLLLWVGTLLAAYLFSMLSLLVAPQEMSRLSKALGTFMTNAPFLLSLLVSALAPAVCEEALCRGVILHSFSGLKRKWLTIALVGVLFGMLHLSLLRFLPTAALGLTLSYIMVETKNLVLPAILHFTNNAFALSLAYITAPNMASVDPELLSGASTVSAGMILVLCAAVPWLLIAGSRLLHTKEENAQRPLKNRVMALGAVVSAVCILAGFIALILGSVSVMGRMKVLDLSYTEDASVSSQPDVFPVVIDKDGNYEMIYSVTGPADGNGKTHFTLTGSDGQEYLGITAESTFGNTQKYLKAGEYTLTFDYEYESSAPEPVTVKFMVMKLFT